MNDLFILDFELTGKKDNKSLFAEKDGKQIFIKNLRKEQIGDEFVYTWGISVCGEGITIEQGEITGTINQAIDLANGFLRKIRTKKIYY